MVNILPIVAAICLLTPIHPYSLEGQWTLTTLNDKTLNIAATIEEFIFR